MTTDTILDLRTLADEWQDLIDDFDAIEEPTADDREQLAEDVEDFEALASQLGCDETPDGLRSYGDDFEPTLIREDYFEDYARELAEDIGAIDPDARWPLGCIDWTRAAHELAADYTVVTVDGHDYYVRA